MTLLKLTGVAFDAKNLFVSTVRKDAEERLRGQTYQILLLQSHGGVDPKGTAFARVRDACRTGQEEPGRKQLEHTPVGEEQPSKKKCVFESKPFIVSQISEKLFLNILELMK